jgi:hypothetical protein
MKFTSTLVLGLFTAVAFTAIPACDDKKEEKKDEKKADAKKDEKKAEEKKEEKKEEEKKEEEKADGGGEGGGGGDKIGIAECDEYIEKYTKCIEGKMPEAGRGPAKDAMKQLVDGWKQAASAGGAAKDALATGCKQALDAAKQATQAMGCEW